MHGFAANDIRPVYTLTSLFLSYVKSTPTETVPHPSPPPPKKQNLMWVLLTGRVAVNSNANPLLSSKCPPTLSKA